MKNLAMISLVFFSVVCRAQDNAFRIVDNLDEKQVDILYNNQLLTAYCWYDSSRKPILFPVNTVDGITVTRGFPFKPVPGDRTDHPHHAGIWMNYESVNGLDFWNNSTAIPPASRDKYGTIVHGEITDRQADGNKASLTTTSHWNRPDGKTLLDEATKFHFSVNGNDFIIDRVTKLTAKDIPVLFKDVKDGLFAIRVARELELPSKEPSNYVDANGNITKVAPSANDVTGMYYSSNGLKGDDVWSSKGPWALLTGKKQGKEISIGIIDHPENTGYPAYWHARGYGLFSLNPLGRKIFSRGKEELNLSLAPGQSLTLRYRVVIRSGHSLKPEDMNGLAADFSKMN